MGAFRLGIKHQIEAIGLFVAIEADKIANCFSCVSNTYEASFRSDRPTN